jgi:flagellar basal-body rod modification protein FlgD
MPTSGVGSATGTTNLAQTLTNNKMLGQDDFLKLLITQLSNQDPLSPQDDKEFIAQMAQFSSVEGIRNLDTNMSRAQAASFLNKSVTAQVTENGVTSNVTGTVKSVTYQSDGVHLLLQSGSAQHDVMLDNLQMVSGG